MDDATARPKRRTPMPAQRSLLRAAPARVRRASRRLLPRLGRALLTLSVLVVMLAGCSNPSDDPGPTLRILSGSENQSLEPLIQAFADKQHASIEVTYTGSVDIMLELGRGSESAYDAVWPANGMWIQLGDTTGATRYAASIFRSPVVLGVKKSVAQALGWVETDVFVDDILAAAEAGRLRFMMSNAAQSDSGAAAYFGFLYAFAGHPDLLTSSDLQSPELRDKIERILGTVGRSAGSSGLLKKAFLDEFDAYDAMFNYEAVLIETNQELLAGGREPLYAIYPVDGTAIADAPLAFIDKDNDEKEALFRELQDYLLSDQIQAELLDLGRRAGPGINPKDADPAVFNPDWGIDTQRVLTPVRIPDADVVWEALSLYQTTFRKPSFTVFVLDYSGSMEGDGEAQLEEAMRLLLDQASASRYLLQASPDDVTIVITFNDSIKNVWQVDGNDPARLLDLSDEITAEKTGGGTDVYRPVIEALGIMKERGTDGYFPAVVLLTDGKSEDGLSYRDLESYVAQNGISGVPIFSIMFGDASREQLDQIAALSSGVVFDGRSDLVAAFRAVRINA